MVAEDNENFMFERHVYSEEFFHFIGDLFLSVAHYITYENFTFPGSLLANVPDLLETYFRFLTEVVYHANEKNNLKDLTNIFKGLMQTDAISFTNFFENFIDGRPKEVFEILLVCNENNVRNSFADILKHCLLFAIREGKIEGSIEKFLNSLMRLIPGEVAKNWTKFQQYFEVNFLYFLKILKIYSL
jgi:ubiquitin carboxyl-terminal hydrolase 34